MRVLAIVIIVLLFAIPGCEPRMSAIEREVRMPRLTVIQITSTPDPLATPARTVIRDERCTNADSRILTHSIDDKHACT